jgi:drug/metabolite transporter (DMT)-like permease
MTTRWMSLGLVVAALTCYHLAQRSTPHAGGPIALFAFVYGISTLIMVLAVALTGPTQGIHQVKAYTTHWAPWLLVAAVNGIELGFYAMYRAGWNISTASITAQSIVATILVVLGVAVLHERLTVTRVLGLVMCVGGAALVAAR